MKKIMFNNTYGLTQAVKQGTKTMTRRVLDLSEEDEEYLDQAFDWDLRESVILDRYAQYKVGEIVAVAESYHELNKQGYLAPEWLDHTCEDSAGYDNKMFVRADLMPHRIRITGRKVERLQNISEADCLKEGIIHKITPVVYPAGGGNNVFTFEGNKGGAWYGSIQGYMTAKVAFAHLIDKVNKKGTWNRNPWVIAYTFELLNED